MRKVLKANSFTQEVHAKAIEIKKIMLYGDASSNKLHLHYSLNILNKMSNAKSMQISSWSPCSH